MRNPDEAGRRETAGVAHPDPAGVVSLSGLCHELDRLRRRHAQRTGGSRPVGLTRLASLTGVPRSTLHTYLTGGVLPSPSALDAVVLALGASLAEAAEWAAALERVSDAFEASGRCGSSSPMRDRFAEIERQMGRPTYWPWSSLQRIALRERVALGADRDISTVTMEVTVRAAVAGVDRYYLFMSPPPEIDLDAFGVSGHVGCRDGEHRSLPDMGLRAFELMLDRPLESGEVSALSFTLERGRARRGPGTPTQQALRHFPRRGPAFTLEVAFRAEDPPAAVRQVHVAEAEAVDGGGHPLRLGTGALAQMALERPAVGLHGMRWEWSDGVAA